MTTVYANLPQETEVIDKSFFETRNPYAKLERDSLARELRKKGWAVKSSKAYFDGRAAGYFLHAERRKPETVTAYAPGQSGSDCCDTF